MSEGDPILIGIGRKKAAACTTTRTTTSTRGPAAGRRLLGTAG